MKHNFTNQFMKGIGSLSVAFLFALMLVILLLMVVLNDRSQTFNPVKFLTFNGTIAASDSIGASHLNFTSYGSQYTVGTNGQVVFVSMTGPL